MRLEGKVAIVTGAAHGIGRAIAAGLSREGADVAIADIDHEGALEAAAKFRHGQRRTLAIKVDVTDAESVKNMTGKVIDVFSRIDILVNNAGIVTRAPLLNLSEAEWDRVLDTNLKSALLCAQSIVPAMMKCGGSIINISSIAADVPTVDCVHYGASKAALIQLTKSMALAFAAYGIRVNAIQPGTIQTRMNDALVADSVDLHRTIPLNRIGLPDEVVGPVIFLASEEAAYITGASLRVDGGATLLR